MRPDDTESSVALALTRVAREDSGRVLAVLARRLGNLDLADESVQDALAEAARTWPERGVPMNPAAWLMAVANRKSIDRLRRAETAKRRSLAAAPELIAESERSTTGYDDDQLDLVVDESAGAMADDQLRLILLCCHPALDRDSQVALTLRMVGGLSTPEVAAAFVQQEATLAQRIVRAKRKIRDAGMPLTIPANLSERLDVVLGVLYLIFNEGYLSRGDSETVVRIDLVHEAVRLTELVTTMVPEHAEALGLLALEHFHSARLSTRVDRDGDLVLLEQQDRSKWDLVEIGRGNSRLHEAMRLMQPGPFQIQAVIAGYHANARTAAETDWPAIVHAYQQLVAITGSAVVRVNHAVAVAMADGPQAGLALLADLDELDRYHHVHAARGEMLLRSGRRAEAASSFDQALALVDNGAERRHLVRRRADCE
jgi:RNA polymerase sigma-70 factor, ECF subfamily